MRIGNRSEPERLTDALLSLVLLRECASEDGRTVGDRLKVTKLLFLAAHNLFSQQVKAFNLSFYRYSYGPFTTELYETWEELVWMGFLNITPGNQGQILLTESGDTAAKHYAERLRSQGNEAILRAFQHITDAYASLSTPELLQRVYSMKVVPLGWQQSISVRDTPSRSFYTCILDDTEAKTTMRLDRATFMEFSNHLPVNQKLQEKVGSDYLAIYESARRGLQAERMGVPSTRVSLQAVKEKLLGSPD